MLTDNLAWEVERIVTREYALIEEELISEIIKDFWKGNDLSLENWRVYKLSQLSEFQASWKSTFARLEKKATLEIVKEVEKAMEQSAKFDDIVIEKVKGDISPAISTPAFKVRLDTVVRMTKEAMNLTGTKAIQKVYDDFLAEINSAYLRVLNGADTLENCLQRATQNLAKHGMTVQYIAPSGRVINYPLDASIRRDIITTVGQAAADYCLFRAEEYGTDLVQVSAHFGARPDHALWQGKVYSISGKTKGYQKLSDATGYGTVTGLCGANCRHTFYPYFAGYSKDIDESEIAGLRENREQYEKQQKQRAYERKIRTLNRQNNAAKITKNDKSPFAMRYKALMKEYTDFLKQKGLTRFSEREK